MIILSGLLVVLAIALLIAGVVLGNSGTEVVGLDGLALIYVSIAVSIVSALCLAIGVFLRRKELFGAPASTSGKTPKGRKQGRKQTRKKAGKGTGGLEPAGGEAATDDTLKIPAQPVDVPGDALVYVVRGRKRYHLDNCRQLVGRQKEELTYAEAQEEGFSPCTACMPDTALAARAAVSADKGPGATGTRERAGSPAGRDQATGSAGKRADKAGSTAAGTSMAAGAPSPGRSAERTTSATGGGRRGPMPSGSRHGKPGSGDDETTAEGRSGRRRDEAAERAGERSASGMGSHKAPGDADSIWLPPAASAPSPRRGGRPAEERAPKPAGETRAAPGPRREPAASAGTADTAEFEAVESAAKRSRDTLPSDTLPPDTGSAAVRDDKVRDEARHDEAGDGKAATGNARGDERRDEDTPRSHAAGARGHGASEHGERADDERATERASAADTVESAEAADRTGGEHAGEGAPGSPAGAGESGSAGDGPQVRILSGTKRYHRPDCALIVDIGEDADDIEALSRAEATARGCTPCLVCEPDKEHARD